MNPGPSACEADVIPLHHVPHDAPVPHDSCPAASKFGTKIVRLVRVSGLAAEPGFLFFVAAAGVRTKGTEEGSAHTSGNDARSGADAEKNTEQCMHVGHDHRNGHTGI